MKHKKCGLPIGLMILGLCFLSGGLLGFSMAGFISQDGEPTLSNYFLAYFSRVEEGNATPNLWTSLWSHLKPPLVVFLLGFSFLGTIGLPIFFGCEGFILAFSISTLCRLMGITGLLPAFFLFCLPALLWVPVLFLLGTQSFHSAILLWGRGKREELFSSKFFIRSGLCFSVVGFLVILDCLVIPVLLQAVVLAV